MTLSAGTRLGPYEVISPLGSGGMGEVYRARDTRLGREVAVKILPSDLAEDRDRLARFEREARSASSLNHPNIVTVYDVGRVDSVSFISLELVEGQTLRELLADGAIPSRRLLAIAAQIADGLAKAHAAGIVHRDLKPENVMISKDGFVKILDFGLAKLAEPAAQSPDGTRASTLAGATEPGVLLGTVGYMSPEQAASRAVDFRSDQFSLGSMLYEMATGRRSFQRDTAVETMTAILRDEPERIENVNPAVPAPLRWTIERCLAKDPEERYASTRDLARDLMGLREHFSEVERAAPSPPPTRPARRGPALLLALLGAAVVGAILGAGAVLWRFDRASEPPILRHLTYSGHDQSPAASPDGKTIAFSSDRDGKRRIWLKQLASGEETAITSGEDEFPRFSPDGSMILFVRTSPPRVSVFRVATLGGEPRKLVDDASSADWSPDGSRIAFVRWLVVGDRTQSALGVAGGDGSGARIITPFETAVVAHPRWSPDGKTIAVTEIPRLAGVPPAVRFVDPQTGRSRTLLASSTLGQISSVVWLRGGKGILYSQSESVLGQLTSSSARLVRQDTRSGRSRSLYWTPSNTSVLDVLAPGRILLDMRSARENLREFPLDGAVEAGLRPLTLGSSTDRQPSYSPDGEWVVFSSNRSGNLDLWALSTRTGGVRRITDDAAEDWDPGFSPDGKQILWSSNRSGNFEIWVADTDGGNARQVSRDGVDAENPTTTPDGRWIVYASGNSEKSGVWRIRADGSEPKRLAEGSLILPETSPDGKWVAYVTNWGTQASAIRVVRLEDGKVVPFHVSVPVGYANVLSGGTALGRTRWMPDGKRIAFIASDEKGITGIYVQDFDPERDTAATRRKLGGFDPQMPGESFGISPDGSRMTVAGWERLYSVLIAEQVPGVEPPPRAAR